MRNLNEILNEGIFDKDLATNDTVIRAEEWANTFLRDYVQPHKLIKESNVDHIDHTKKKIFLKGIPWGVCVDATVKSFNGFFPEYDIVDKNEKESIKQLLQGQELDSTMVRDILKKLDSINNNINDKDATKDRFGEKLSYGDIVLIADSSSSQWPSMLDVYKDATSGGRIRTEYRSQLPPRNVIKINNPKILELLK